MSDSVDYTRRPQNEIDDDMDRLRRELGNDLYLKAVLMMSMGDILYDTDDTTICFEVRCHKNTGKYGVLWAQCKGPIPPNIDFIYAFNDRFDEEADALESLRQIRAQYQDDEAMGVSMWGQVFKDRANTPGWPRLKGADKPARKKNPSGTVQLGKGYDTTQDKIELVAKAIYAEAHSVSLQKTDDDFKKFHEGWTKLVRPPVEYRNVQKSLKQAKKAILAFLDENPQRMHNDGRAEEYADSPGSPI